MQAWRFLIALALGAGLAACATDPEEGSEDWEDCGGKCDDASSGVAPLNAPDLLVNDLAVLGQLERAGFDLGGRLGGASVNNAMLASSSPVYRQLGACMPPYFIFQARVDGHQVPSGGDHAARIATTSASGGRPQPSS